MQLIVRSSIFFFCPKVRAQQTGCFNSREGERSGRHSWMGEKEAFDELSVKVHQSTHIFKTPRCLLSAFRLIFLHIVGNLSILAHGIIHSWPI